MTGVVLPYRNVRPRIAPSVYLAPTAAVIGNVAVGAESSLWFGVAVRGDVNEIRILQDGTVVHVTGGGLGTYIGDDVTVGHMAVLHACTLHSGSFVGMKACIMDGAVVETGAMVAAGALLSPGKRVPRGELWAGVPARPMRPLTPEEQDGILASARRYAVLAAEYRGATGG